MAERLNRSVLYTFGVGDLCFSLMINMEVYFFAAFLTDYAQFSLARFHQILSVTSLADIICALVAGIILQKATLKFGGKYRSWLLVGPPIVVPLFILQFSKIGADSMAVSIIILGYIASHLVFNVVFAAYGSMVGILSQLPDDRTILSTSRAQGASVAGLIFSITALPMITFFSARINDILGHTITTAVYAVLMMLGYWYIYWITAGRDPNGKKSTPVSEKESGQTVREIILLVFKNAPLLLLIIAETFRNASLFFVASFAFYYFGYVLKNPAFLSGFILAIHIAGLLGTFAAVWVGVRIGKRNAYWLSLGSGAVCFALAIFAGGTTWGFTAIFSIGYMFNMIAGSMTTALFADTAIYGEWKTGKSIRGFTMALITLPIKIGLFLRAQIIALGLVAIGFIANTTPEPNVVRGISYIMIIAPAAANAVAATLFYFGYKIDDKHILQMQNEIAAR